MLLSGLHRRGSERIYSEAIPTYPSILTGGILEPPGSWDPSGSMDDVGSLDLFGSMCGSCGWPPFRDLVSIGAIPANRIRSSVAQPHSAFMTLPGHNRSRVARCLQFEMNFVPSWLKIWETHEPFHINFVKSSHKSYVTSGVLLRQLLTGATAPRLPTHWHS